MHRIVDSRCVLAVRDLHASTRFYVDVLGFSLRDFGDGSDGWSFLRRDAFENHAWRMSWREASKRAGGPLVHGEVDSSRASINSCGSRRGRSEVLSQPATEPWGLRELSIRTPDGHRIRFGEPTGVAG